MSWGFGGTTVAKAQVELDADLNPLKRGLSNAEMMTKRAGTNMSSSFDGAFKSLRNFTVGLVASGGLVYGIKSVVDAASDMNETLTKTDQVFGSSSDTIKEWSKTSAEALKMSRQEALAAASDYGALSTAMGFTEDDAASMSMNLVKLAGDLASFHNLSTEETERALRAVFTGEYEPLKDLGVIINETRLKQEGLTRGLIHGKEQLTQQQKVWLSYQLVLKDTAKAQGDLNRTGDGFANQQRELQARLADLKVEIGNNLLPLFNRWLTKLNELIESVQEGGRNHEKFKEKIEQVKDAAKTLYGWFIDIKDAIQKIVDKMGGWETAAKTAFGLVMLNRISKIVGALGGEKGGLLATLRLLTRNPWVIAVTLAATLIFSKSARDSVTEFFEKNLNDWIKNKTGVDLNNEKNNTIDTYQEYEKLSPSEKKTFLDLGLDPAQLPGSRVSPDGRAQPGAPTGAQTVRSLPGTAAWQSTGGHAAEAARGYPAVDVSFKANQPVGAPADGYVKDVHMNRRQDFKAGYGGWNMYIDTDAGEYFITHLMNPTVSAGDTISQGQIIGYAAGTAIGGGIHIHIGFKSSGGKTDIPPPPGGGGGGDDKTSKKKTPKIPTLPESLELALQRAQSPRSPGTADDRRALRAALAWYKSKGQKGNVEDILDQLFELDKGEFDTKLEKALRTPGIKDEQRIYRQAISWYKQHGLDTADLKSKLVQVLVDYYDRRINAAEGTPGTKDDLKALRDKLKYVKKNKRDEVDEVTKSIKAIRDADFEVPSGLQSRLDEADALIERDDPDSERVGVGIYGSVLKTLKKLLRNADVTQRVRKQIKDKITEVADKIAAGGYDLGRDKITAAIEGTKQQLADMVSTIGNISVNIGERGVVGDQSLQVKRYDPLQGKWVTELAPSFNEVQAWRKDMEQKRDAAEVKMKNAQNAYNNFIRTGKLKGKKKPVARRQAIATRLWNRYQDLKDDYESYKALAADALAAEGDLAAAMDEAAAEDAREAEAYAKENAGSSGGGDGGGGDAAAPEPVHPDPTELSPEIRLAQALAGRTVDDTTDDKTVLTQIHDLYESRLAGTRDIEDRIKLINALTNIESQLRSIGVDTKTQTGLIDKQTQMMLDARRNLYNQYGSNIWSVVPRSGALVINQNFQSQPTDPFTWLRQSQFAAQSIWG